MNSAKSSGLRKGAWTEEEDILLRKCIEKYGEGKWHQVPIRAGLNRCRKSCRLRWLNYLRPHIKRGDFSEDEVDLILRLHKLLGNRWSLIAGRLPGRTANDIKNYWNTNLQRKLLAPHRQGKTFKCANKITENNIVRPRPRTFSSITKNNVKSNTNNTIISKANESCEQISNATTCDMQTTTSTTTGASTGDAVQWWTRLLANCNENEQAGAIVGNMSCFEEHDDDKLPNLLHHEEINGEISKCMQQGQIGWDDFRFDVDLWNLLN